MVTISRYSLTRMAQTKYELELFPRNFLLFFVVSFRWQNSRAVSAAINTAQGQPMTVQLPKEGGIASARRPERRATFQPSLSWLSFGVGLCLGQWSWTILFRLLVHAPLLFLRSFWSFTPHARSCCAGNPVEDHLDLAIGPQSWALKVWLSVGAVREMTDMGRSPWSSQIDPKTMSLEEVRWPNPGGRCVWVAAPGYCCMCS